VVDVFKTLEIDLKLKRTQFILKTKKYHNNQNGSITLISLLFTIMISGLFLFYSVKNKIELKEARYRKESYLCFNYLNIETENYILDMAKFNVALRTLFLASLTGYGSAQAKTLFIATKYSRNLRHLQYVKALVKNNYCKESKSSLSYFKNFPFLLNKLMVLETNADETTKPKGQKWKVIYFKVPNGIRFKNSFYLEASFQVQGNFLPNPRVSTREISMKDFSKLKCCSAYL
jgi:hypothetical protein